MDNELVNHLMEIKESLATVQADTKNITIILMGGGATPGLVQEVKDLQAAKNWTWGMGAGTAFLSGIAEWLFHHHGK